MSNHDGGYLLNSVLELLDEREVFDWLGKDKTQQLVLEIVNLACNHHDCNSGEILEGLGQAIGIC